MFLPFTDAVIHAALTDTVSSYVLPESANSVSILNESDTATALISFESDPDPSHCISLPAGMTWTSAVPYKAPGHPSIFAKYVTGASGTLQLVPGREN
jgi:hypothetical protein